MRQREDEPATIAPAVTPFRVISGTDDEAKCAQCGAPTGMHPKWWFDGNNELVPYCADCAGDYS
jgi:hypothetical protein